MFSKVREYKINIFIQITDTIKGRHTSFANCVSGKGLVVTLYKGRLLSEKADNSF